MNILIRSLHLGIKESRFCLLAFFLFSTLVSLLKNDLAKVDFQNCLQKYPENGSGFWDGWRSLVQKFRMGAL